MEVKLQETCIKLPRNDNYWTQAGHDRISFSSLLSLSYIPTAGIGDYNIMNPSHSAVVFPVEQWVHDYRFMITPDGLTRRFSHISHNNSIILEHAQYIIIHTYIQGVHNSTK